MARERGPVGLSGTLRVIRLSAPWRDRFRAYKVMVDGRSLGRVKNGETAEFEIPASLHRVRMAIGWTGSEEIEFTLPEGGLVEVECSAKAAVGAVFDLFRRDQWVDIWLKDAEE